MGTLFLLLLAFAASADDPSPIESGAVREVHIGAPRGADIQHFVLEEGTRARAIARFSTWPLPDGGRQLELETRFLDRDLVVSHVERITPTRRLLSWRERSSAGLRSVFLDGSDELQGWIGEGHRRRRVVVSSDVILPLEWISVRLANDARTDAALLTTFDPLTGCPRAVEVRAEGDDSWCWWSEGRPRERYQFAAGELIGYAWRSSLVRARRITPREHAERLAQAVRAGRDS